MSIIISFITIGLFKSVSSVCVYGSPPEDYIEGIQGEYTYAGRDINYHSYYKKSIGSDCNAYSQSHNSYIRIGQRGEWEISYDPLFLLEDNFWYRCYDDADLRRDDQPECPSNTWWNEGQAFNTNPRTKGLKLITGECPSSQAETYLTVTDYSHALTGCNGEFIAIDGKQNLYKSIEQYDYGWTNEWGQPTGELVYHYWFYNYNAERWICDYENLEDPQSELYNYANLCRWSSSTDDGTNMTFYD